MMKSLAFAAVLLSSSASFAQDVEPSPEPLPTIEEKFFADVVEPIVAEQCVACHSAAFAYADVELDSLEGILANKDAVLAQIEAGTMPAGNPEWKDTVEATTLLYWLAQQQDEEAELPEDPAE